MTKCTGWARGRETNMPIRKRGDSWQIDVRTIDGVRIRRNFPTKEAAQEAEAALKPNPSMRAAMRRLRRKQSARKRQSSPTSAGPSSRHVDTSSRKTSNLLTLPPSVGSGQTEPRPQDATSTANSGQPCAASEPPAKP